MPRIHIDNTEAFLNDRQRAFIADSQALAHDLEFPPDGGEPFTKEFAMHLGGHLVSGARIMRAGRKQLAGRIETIEDLGSTLGTFGAYAIGSDTVFTALSQCIALTTAYHQINEEVEDAFRGRNIGRQIAERRALSNTNTILSTFRFVLNPLNLGGERVPSILDQAKSTYRANPKLRPPADVLSPEGETFDRLVKAEREAIVEARTDTDSTTGIRGIGRVLKNFRKTKRDLHLGTSIIDIAQITLESDQTKPIGSFTEQEQRQVERTSQKLTAYIERAARANEDLTNNPVAQFLIFIRSNLDVFDTSTGYVSFERSVNQTIKRAKKK